MYYYEITDGIDAQVENATIVHLNELWHRFRDTGGELPQYPDLSPERLTWCSADLMVVAPEEDEDFRYHYYGQNIAATAGFDMTGKRTSDFRSEVGRYFRDAYRRCLEARVPMYTLHRATHAAAVHTWERLLMPVRRDGEGWIVVLNRPVTFRHEFLQSVLESTENGIVSLAVLRDSHGRPEDFYILSVNHAAARILGANPVNVTERRLGEAIAGNAMGRLAQLCRDVYDSGLAASTEVHGMYNGVHRNIKASAAKVADTITLTLADVAPIRSLESALEDLERRLSKESEARQQLEAALRTRSDTDAITGTLGRDAFVLRLEGEVARALRHERGLGLLVLALDRFQVVVGLHGEEARDRALAEVAAVCSRELRRSDFLGRMETGEFAICLTDIADRRARQAAERLREAVADAFADQAMLSMRLTASVGVAELKPAEDYRALLARAAAGVQQAKREGRNRVATAT